MNIYASFIFGHGLFFIHSVEAAYLHICFSARGFGGGGSSVNKGAPSVSLSKEAKKLLKRHGNNVDAASSEYFRTQMEKIEGGSIDEMHAARVAATWNTVALFLPQDYQRMKGKLEPTVERRLRHIGTACQGDKDNNFELLDVGCGDGSLVPFIPDKCRYWGLDLSTEMIALAKQKHVGRNFCVGSFPQITPTGSLFDAIVFNGSIQFFRDTRRVIDDAASLLKPGGRIVIAHVNGAKFVKTECQKNPSLAVRNMPSKVNLETMATLVGLKVLDKKMLRLVEYEETLDGETDDFYLVALEKP